MAKFLINQRIGESFEVEAEQFATVGGFVDFVAHDGRGGFSTVFRIKSDLVFTIELVK
jgi:hypothetical protein